MLTPQSYIPSTHSLLEMWFQPYFGGWHKWNIEYDNWKFYEWDDIKNVNSEQELQLLISLSESN